jgi:hypothetical protein
MIRITRKRRRRKLNLKDKRNQKGQLEIMIEMILEMIFLLKNRKIRKCKIDKWKKTRIIIRKSINTKV